MNCLPVFWTENIVGQTRFCRAQMFLRVPLLRLLRWRLNETRSDVLFIFSEFMDVLGAPLATRVWTVFASSGMFSATLVCTRCVPITQHFSCQDTSFTCQLCVAQTNGFWSSGRSAEPNRGTVWNIDRSRVNCQYMSSEEEANLSTEKVSEMSAYTCQGTLVGIRDSAVGLATGYGLDGRVPAEWSIFSSTLSRPAWGLPNLLSNGYGGGGLTTHLQLMPRSRKCGSIHPLPHTPSWRSA
jgi:hypothetical protein